MAFFIFPHDDIAISVDCVRSWLAERTDIGEGDGQFSLLRWKVGASPAFECSLSADAKAVWADPETAESCDYLAALACALLLPMDLCDERYAAHIHLHELTSEQSPWKELLRAMNRGT